MDRARPGILNFLAKCPDCDACLANEFVTVDSRISSPNRSSNNAPASLITEKKKKKRIHPRKTIDILRISRETSPFFIPPFIVDPPETDNDPVLRGERLSARREISQHDLENGSRTGDLSVIYRFGRIRIVWKILEFSFFFFSFVRGFSNEFVSEGKECVTFRDKEASLLWNLIKKKKKCRFFFVSLFRISC